MIYKGKYATHFVNIDRPDEVITVENEGQGNDFGDKAPGKASTYAEKLNILKGLCLISGIQDEARNEGEGDGGTTAQKPAPATIKEPQRKSETAAPAEPAAAPAAPKVGADPKANLKAAVKAAKGVESKGAASAGLTGQIKAAADSKGVTPLIQSVLTLGSIELDAMSKEVAAAVWKWIGEQPEVVEA